MKIFQILNDLCHVQLNHTYIKDIPDGTYTEEFISQLVEAPDYVFVGWGYIDGNFIKPTPPEGFEYDNNTGTIYPTGDEPLKIIQVQTFPKLSEAVKNNTITKELFAEITGEAFIEFELKEVLNNE